MSDVFRFADFELHALQRQLFCRGQPVQVGGRAMDLLLCLVQQRHRTVAKDELIDQAWPDQAVEPNNLAVQVWALRRLLGSQSILTVPGRGYRFVLPIANDETSTPPSVAQPTPTSFQAAAMLPLMAPMFGRDTELAQVQALLQAHRLVTLLGPPGVGKTRLAMAVLAAYAARGRRALRVDLATVETAEAVEDAVRLQLGQIGRPHGAAPNSSWQALVDEAPLLLLLDNCEHLVGAVAALAEAMLAQAPGVVLLGTSQRPLKLPAEQQLRLRPLEASPSTGVDAADAPALQLLVDRVQALDATWRLDDPDRPVALELCRRLDGLPLAIEMAAVRVPTLGVRGVLARLQDRLRLLTDGRAAQRHRTLAAALDWSVSLLDAPLQSLFDVLGVFHGSFSVELAVAVGAASGLDEWAALDGIGRLAENSLLVAETSGEVLRLRMLETVRAQALKRLQAADRLPPLRRLHAEAVCSLLGHQGREREAGRLSADTVLQAVRDELDNVRAALTWVLEPWDDKAAEPPDSRGCTSPERATIGHSIVADAWPAMMLLGLHDEAARWMLALLPHLHDGTPPRTAGFMLVGLGKIGLRTAALPPRHRHALLQRAQPLLDALPGSEYAAAVRQTLAQSACQLGDAAEALATAEAALALMRPCDPAGYRADLIVWRGIALALLGRLAEAAEARAEALPLCIDEGNGDFVFLLLSELAELEALLGLHSEAVARWRFLTAAAAARGVHSQVLAPLWAGLQGSLVALNDAAAGRTAAAEVWRHMELLGRPLEGCHLHAALLALEGHAEPAAWLMGAGDRQWQATGERRLLFEGTAREAACVRLHAAADEDLVAQWQRHGRTFTPADVRQALFGDQARLPAIGNRRPVA